MSKNRKFENLIYVVVIMLLGNKMQKFIFYQFLIQFQKEKSF